MLASEKIAKAFLAIVEEAEKIQNSLPPGAQESLKTIVSIAKHQSDIRGLQGGNCKSDKSACGCKGH